MKISDEVMTVLGQAETVGKTLKLTGQLDRKLYLKVNDVLAAVGGKWNRGAKAHLFDIDADEALDEILATGEVATGKEFGFFETPVGIAKHLINIADVRLDMNVLEPSAGLGAIVLPLITMGAKVTAYEIQEKNAEALKKINGKTSLGCLDRLHVQDFLKAPPQRTFDRVVMNPPFGRRQDIHHVRHALSFLKPGGRLVSVMSAGVKFREDRLGRDFRQLVSDHAGSFEDCPQGSFKVSGTMVRTVIVDMNA
jgi:predicted RNA methylase